MRTVKELTSRELDVVSAWWIFGSVVDAAEYLGLHHQTAKNALHLARIRTGAPTTLALAQMFSDDLLNLKQISKHVRKAA